MINNTNPIEKAFALLKRMKAFVNTTMTLDELVC